MYPWQWLTVQLSYRVALFPGLPRFVLQFVLRSSASVYYTERKPKNKNVGGLGSVQYTLAGGRSSLAEHWQLKPEALGSISGNWQLFIFSVHFVQLNEISGVHFLCMCSAISDFVLWSSSLEEGHFPQEWCRKSSVLLWKNKYCHVTALYPHITCEDDIMMTCAKKEWGFP